MVAFFEKSVVKEVHILRYIHNIGTVLIPKFQNKAIVYSTFRSSCPEVSVKKVFLEMSQNLQETPAPEPLF